MVYLNLDGAEVEPIREAAIQTLDVAQYGVITEVFPDGSSGDSQLSLELEAGSQGGAISVAGGIWNNLRSAAGLKPRAPHLAFLVGPVNQSALQHQELLHRARVLVAQGNHDYAVVAAQTALEVHVRGVLRDLSRSAMGSALADVIQPQSFSLRDRSSEKLLAGLIGKSPKQVPDVWQPYDEHVVRRNGVVHNGANVEKADAEASIAAVQKLIRWIDKAVAAAS